MTYKILMDDTHWIIHHSNIHSAADPNARNLRLDLLNDEPPEVIQSLCKASPALDHGEDFSLHSMEPTDEHPYTESTPDPSERPSTGDDKVIVNPQDLLGRTFLMDATITEMSQLKEYECCINAGIYGRDKPPDGHKKICAHLVFDVKHDGHHKACYVAGGHLTDVPNASVYSGVVSL
jgi:hypothetical protein